MNLSIIIVNYKTPQLTINCINSIYKSESELSYEIIVVDNNSQDDSLKLIRKNFPKVKTIANEINEGFGRANNLGVKYAKGKFLLFLNSDVILLKECDLQSCLNQFEKDSEIGVLGCKLLNEDFSVQKSTYYDVSTFRSLLSQNILWYKIFKPKPKSLDAVMGAFMIIPRELFIKVEGFDKDFFMYAEELELCLRIKKEENKIKFFKHYFAIHKHGGSSKNNSWPQRQNILSNALLYFKARGWIGYFVYHLIFNFNIITNTLLSFTLPKKSIESYKKLYKAYFSNFKYYIKLPFYFTFVKKRQFLKAKL